MPKSNLTRGLREQIAIELRSDIVGGRLAPGYQMVERHLALRFGVSHAPIREVLLQLTHEGLLVAEINRGAQVAPAASRELRQLFFPIRQRLEVYALESTLGRLGEADLKAWRDTAGALVAAWKRRDAAGIARSDFAFHETIIERTGQFDVISAWRTAIARARLTAAQCEELHACKPDAAAEHLAVIDRAEARDKAGAITALVKCIGTDANVG